MERVRSPRPDPALEEAAAPEDAPEVVRLVHLFLKALKAYRLYLPNHRTLKGFVDSFAQALDEHLAAHGDLCLRVHQFRISRGDETVYENNVKEESLAFRLYIHGVREMTFHAGVPLAEVNGFLQVLHRAFDTKSTADDLLALLWEKDFRHVSFLVLDDFFEEGEQAEFEEFLEDGRRADGTAGAVKATMRPLLDRLLANSRGEDSRPIPDFLELTPEETERVSDWLAVERSRDLLKDLCGVVLDLLELEADEQEARELLSVVDRLVETLLGDGKFVETMKVLGELRAFQAQAQCPAPVLKAVEEALSRLNGERLVALLRPRIAEAADHDRDHLVEFLAGLDGSAIPTLVELTAEAETREPAIRALSRLAGAHFGLLVLRLKDPRPAVTAAVLRVLGEHRDPRALTPISALLGHADGGIRREAIRAVGAIGTDAAFPMLLQVLGDPSPELRLAAVRALSALPREIVRRPLFEVVHSRDFAKRSAFEKKEILLVLAATADPDVENWLLTTVRRRSWFRREERDELRACALPALVRLGTIDAMDVVRNCTNDPSEEVRRAATLALRAGSRTSETGHPAG